MRYELWNTRSSTPVAVWTTEAEAREHLRQQPGLASEPHRLLLRCDGQERVLAEQDHLLAWAETGLASE